MRYILLFGAAMLLAAAPEVSARDRYAERPPVLVSPDLSAPWVMQLRGNRSLAVRRPQVQRVRPMRQSGYRVRPERSRPATSSNAQLRRKARTQNVTIYPQPTLQDARRSYRQRVPSAVQRVAVVAPRPSRPQIDPMYLPQVVSYETKEKPGTIIIDTRQNFLYLVQEGGKARRYGVGTGKPGFEWAGTHRVTQKREWPDWRPPAEMIARERKKGRVLPVHMPGGPENPLGARALYLGSTLYRIHGTNQPWTIGGAVSSGCIRMRNEDVIDLYERVKVGTKVVVS